MASECGCGVHPGGCLSPGPESSPAWLCPARGGPGICWASHGGRSDPRWGGHCHPGVPLLGQHFPHAVICHPRVCFLHALWTSVRCPFRVLLVFCPAQGFACLSVSARLGSSRVQYTCASPSPRRKPTSFCAVRNPFRRCGPSDPCGCFRADVGSAGLGSAPCTGQGKPSLVPPHRSSLQCAVSTGCPSPRPAPPHLPPLPLVWGLFLRCAVFRQAVCPSSVRANRLITH